MSLSLTKDCIRSIVQGSTTLDIKQAIKCQYVMQLIENYIPQTNQQNLDKLICFRLSDGYTKMKALFQKISSPELCLLRVGDTLTKYPVMRVTQYKLACKATADEQMILVQEYEILQQLDQIIGNPISYKAYQMNNYNNPNGALTLEEFDIDIDGFIDNSVEEIPIPQQPLISTQPYQQHYQQQQVQKTLQQHGQIKQSNAAPQVIKLQQQPSYQPQVIQQQKQLTISMKQIKPPQVQQQQQHQQQLPQQQAQHPKSTNNIDYYPISMLNPKFQEPFRGRIVKIDDIKQYGGKNGKKEGKLFSVNILDEDSLIVATFFDAVADKFHSSLELGKVYKFKGVQIKPARNVDQNKQLGILPYDYSFDHMAQIIEIEDTADIAQNKFNFIKLDGVLTSNKDTIVDVIGVLKSVTDVIEFQPRYKEGKQRRRQLQIYDDSEREIEITLYGGMTTQFDYVVGNIYMFKRFKLSEYQGQKSLVSSFSSSVHYDGNCKECRQLMQWQQNFKGQLKEAPAKIKLIQQLNEESVNLENDPNLKLFSEVRAHLVLIKNTGTLFYQSCTNCLKKVQQLSDVQYHCTTCNIYMKEPKYRYILSCKIADSSGSMWIVAMDQQAINLVDVSANRLKVLMDEGKEQEKMDALNAKLYKEFRFKLVSKSEEFNETKRVKHQVSSIVPISTQDTLAILESVQQYVQHI